MAKLLVRNVAWHGTELSVTCPAITPVLGDEVLTNTGFEGTYTAGVATGWSKFSNIVPSEEISIVHGGDKAQRLTVGSGVLQGQTLVANSWYAASAYVNVASGSLSLGFTGWLEVLLQGVTSGYEQITTHSIMTAASQFGIVGSTSLDAYVDDASVKMFTFSTLHTYLGKRPANCVVDFAPTLAETHSYVGVLVRYKDANNYVFVGLFGTEVQIIKCVAGTLSQVAAAVTTGYGFTIGDQLHAELNGTTIKLWYNGSVLLTGTIADQGLGNEIHGFSTHASNSVGAVTTGSLTDGSRVDVLFAFDDGYTSQYTYGFGYLYGVCGKPGTINLMAGQSTLTESQLNEMYIAGWDLANHSIDSDSLSGLTQEAVETKLTSAKDWLDTHGYTRASSHVAYPGGAYDDNTLAAMAATGMLTGRTTGHLQFVPAFTSVYVLQGDYKSKAQTEVLMPTAIICKQTLSYYCHAMIQNDSELVDYIISAGCNILSITQWYAKHHG